MGDIALYVVGFAEEWSCRISYFRVVTGTTEAGKWPELLPTTQAALSTRYTGNGSKLCMQIVAGGRSAYGELVSSSECRRG